MTRKTPKTDANLLILDCDDSCLGIYVKTKDGKEVTGDIVSADFARELELENEAMRNAITSAVECIVGLDLHLENNHGLFILLALDKLQPFAK